MQKGRGKGQDTGLDVGVSVCFLFLLCCCNQIQLRLACGLLWEVRFAISPLQRIDGHMHPIKTIDIGRHEQRVMYAYVSIGFAKSFVCVVINEQQASRQSTHKKRTSNIIIDTI